MAESQPHPEPVDLIAMADARHAQECTLPECDRGEHEALSGRSYLAEVFAEQCAVGEATVVEPAEPAPVQSGGVRSTHVAASALLAASLAAQLAQGLVGDPGTVLGALGEPAGHWVLGVAQVVLVVAAILVPPKGESA